MNHLFSKQTLQAMLRRKTLAQAQAQGPEDGEPAADGTTTTTLRRQDSMLRRTLTAVDLILYGVGSSVGAGIFVLVGL
jgi:amino acid permease